MGKCIPKGFLFSAFILNLEFMSNYSARTVVFLKISLYKHFLETKEEQDSPTQDKLLGDSSVYLAAQVGKRQT